jgi:hypothetical protein
MEKGGEAYLDGDHAYPSCVTETGERYAQPSSMFIDAKGIYRIF